MDTASRKGLLFSLRTNPRFETRMTWTRKSLSSRRKDCATKHPHLSDDSCGFSVTLFFQYKSRDGRRGQIVKQSPRTTTQAAPYAETEPTKHSQAPDRSSSGFSVTLFFRNMSRDGRRGSNADLSHCHHLLLSSHRVLFTACGSDPRGGGR